MDILCLIVEIIMGGAVLIGIFVFFLALFYALNP